MLLFAVWTWRCSRPVAAQNTEAQEDIVFSGNGMSGGRFNYEGNRPLSTSAKMMAVGDYPAAVSASTNGFSSPAFDGRGLWFAPWSGEYGVYVDTVTANVTDVYFEAHATLSSRYVASVFDGNYTWVVPYDESHIVRIDNTFHAINGAIAWPSGFVKPPRAFSGAVYDGNGGLWLAPDAADAVVALNTWTATSTKYSDYPAGCPDCINGGAFSGIASDGSARYVYLIPAAAQKIVSVRVRDGSMVGFSAWPGGFTKSANSFNGGTVFQGKLWLAPSHSPAGVLYMDLASGLMTLLTEWPSGWSDSGGINYMGACHDGARLWLSPSNNQGMLIAVGANTGTMESSSVKIAGAHAGCAWDGRSLWLAPRTNNDDILRVSSLNITSWTNANGMGSSAEFGLPATPLGPSIRAQNFSRFPDLAYSNGGVYGAAYDGQFIWMPPNHREDPLLQLDPSSGEMWPHKFDVSGLSTIADGFSGVALDQHAKYLWLIPSSYSHVVRFNVQDYTQVGYSGWPVAKGTYSFAGGVIAEGALNLAPFNYDRIVRVATATGVMTGYNSWPLGFTKDTAAFNGAVFVARQRIIYFLPSSASAILSMMAGTNVIDKHDAWPLGYSTGPNRFFGGVFDGHDSIWLCPRDADRVIRFNVDTQNFAGFLGWPSGYAHYPNSNFGSIHFDGEALWLIPMAQRDVIRVERTTGSMTLHRPWPSYYTKPTDFGWAGSVWDGRDLWLAPMKMFDSQVMRLRGFGGPILTAVGDGGGSSGPIAANPIGPSLVALTAFDDFPFGYHNTSAGTGATCYDGSRFLYFVPNGAKGLLRFDTLTGNMMNIEGIPAVGSQTYYGAACVFGKVWLIPYRAPLVSFDPTTLRFTKQESWPAGYMATINAFYGAAYDGNYGLWLGMHNADRLIKLDVRDGSMSGYNNWPGGFVPSGQCFAGAIYDGFDKVYYVPYRCNSGILRMRPVGPSMSYTSGLPGDITLGATPYIGGASDGTYIWFAPYTADKFLRYHLTTNVMSSLAIPTDAGGSPTFHGAFYDGTSVWMVPDGADGLVVIDAASTKASVHKNWPEGYGKTPDRGFNGAAFDGTSLWLAPEGENPIIRVSPASATVSVTVVSDTKLATASATPTASTSPNRELPVPDLVPRVGPVSHVLGTATPGFVNGAAPTARMTFPRTCGTTLDGTRVLVSYRNELVQEVRFTPNAVLGSFAGSSGNANTAYGVGTAAHFEKPQGIVAVDASLALILDQGQFCVRAVDLLTDFVGPYAGSCGSMGTADGARLATATFNELWGVGIDRLAPNLASPGDFHAFIVDKGSNTIRRLTSLLVTTVAGDAGAGPAFADNAVGTLARFSTPVGFAVSDGGIGLIGDAGNRRIRQINVRSTAVTTIAGDGTPGDVDGFGTSALVSMVMGIAYTPSGSGAFFCEQTSHVRLIIPLTTQVVTVIGRTGSTTWSSNADPLNAELNRVSGLCVCGASQRLYIVGEHAMSMMALETRTLTVSRSASPPPTATLTGSLSVSASPTASMSMSTTATVSPPPTPTASNSSTATASVAPTRTRTDSATASPSAPSPTVSVSTTPTRSPPPTVTPSSSMTYSRSVPPTPTQSSSATASIPPTRSASPTGTASRSPPPTPTDSTTATSTPSVPPTPTSTETPTQSLPPTMSGSLSVTRTRSLPPTPTASASSSQTLTVLPTSTWSATATASAVPTASVSTSPSLTRSPVATRSATGSNSASVSPVPTGTTTNTRTRTTSPSRLSPSRTASPTRPPTRSATRTPPSSASRSSSRTVTATPSMPPTPTVSGSQSHSSTSTRSPPPTRSSSTSDTETATASLPPTATPSTSTTVSSSSTVSIPPTMSFSRSASVSPPPTATPTKSHHAHSPTPTIGTPTSAASDTSSRSPPADTASPSVGESDSDSFRTASRSPSPTAESESASRPTPSLPQSRSTSDAFVSETASAGSRSTSASDSDADRFNGNASSATDSASVGSASTLRTVTRPHHLLSATPSDGADSVSASIGTKPPTVSATRSPTESAALPTAEPKAIPLSKEMETATEVVGTTTVAASAAASPAAAVQMARVLGVIGIARRCAGRAPRADGFIDQKLTFPQSFVPPFGFGPAKGKYFRGAVVANGVMTCGALLVGFALTVAFLRWQQRRKLHEYLKAKQRRDDERGSDKEDSELDAGDMFAELGPTPRDDGHAEQKRSAAAKSKVPPVPAFTQESMARTCKAAAARLRMPASAVVCAAISLDGTILCAAALIITNARFGDVLLAVVGILLHVVSLGLVVLSVLHVLSARAAGDKRAIEHTEFDVVKDAGAREVVPLRAPHRWLLVGTTAWLVAPSVPAREETEVASVMQRFGMVMARYRGPVVEPTNPVLQATATLAKWWLLVEMILTIIVAIAQALTLVNCAAASILALVANVAGFLLAVLVRPYTVPAKNLLLVVVLGLMAAGSCALIGSVFAHDAANAKTLDKLGSQLAAAAGMVGLASLLLTGAKAVVLRVLWKATLKPRGGSVGRAFGVVDGGGDDSGVDPADVELDLIDLGIAAMTSGPSSSQPSRLPPPQNISEAVRRSQQDETQAEQAKAALAAARAELSDEEGEPHAATPSEDHTAMNASVAGPPPLLLAASDMSVRHRSLALSSSLFDDGFAAQQASADDASFSFRPPAAATTAGNDAAAATEDDDLDGESSNPSFFGASVTHTTQAPLPQRAADDAARRRRPSADPVVEQELWDAL